MKPSSDPSAPISSVRASAVGADLSTLITHNYITRWREYCCAATLAGFRRHSSASRIGATLKITFIFRSARPEAAKPQLREQ